MAESCSTPNINNNLSASVPSDADLSKTDCTSPSPTETVCLESICAGPSTNDRLAPVKHKLNEISLSFIDSETICEEKDSFLNKLGLDKREECSDGDVDVNNEDEECFNAQEGDDDAWEDCIEDDEHRNVFYELDNDTIIVNNLEENSCIEASKLSNCESSKILIQDTIVSDLTTAESKARVLRKRKLNAQSGFPCKKLVSNENKCTGNSNSNNNNNSSSSCSTSSTSSHSNEDFIETVLVSSSMATEIDDKCISTTSSVPFSITSQATSTQTTEWFYNSTSCSTGDKQKQNRNVIPTKDHPPPGMSEWLSEFQHWSNAERIVAIDQLIERCELTQVRHMMQVIEPQFQRDFISLLPKELALTVLSFLEPRDLLRAAQTCRNWRFLAEDNLLWKEKCKQAGIDEMVPKKIIRGRNNQFLSSSTLSSSLSSSSATAPSTWKAAYMRQHQIEMNWRIKPIRPPKVLKGHDDHVITCLQFSGNKIVSGSDDNTLKVWSAITGKCLRTLVGHTGGVWSSQMSDNTIISGSTDRTLKVWNAETGQCIHTLYGHTSTVRCMHLHDNKVVSGSRDATLRVWDIDSGECLHILVGHLAAVRCVQYDGRLVVSGAYDYMVKVWNAEREECLHTLQGHTNRVYSLQFDGIHVVSGSLDTSIRVWEVETGACRHTLMGHQSLTSGMELRNNILVSGNADSTVKVWDIVTGQCLQTLSGPNKHQSAVTCLQFNNRFVITSSDDGTVKLWDVRTGEFIRNLVALDSGGSGGVVWRIRASDTKLVCAVGSRNGTEETKLLVLDFDVETTTTTTQTTATLTSIPLPSATTTATINNTNITLNNINDSCIITINSDELPAAAVAAAAAAAAAATAAATTTTTSSSSSSSSTSTNNNNLNNTSNTDGGNSSGTSSSGSSSSSGSGSSSNNNNNNSSSSSSNNSRGSNSNNNSNNAGSSSSSSSGNNTTIVVR